jgi:hypothetical protein
MPLGQTAMRSALRGPRRGSAEGISRAIFPYLDGNVGTDFPGIDPTRPEAIRRRRESINHFTDSIRRYLTDQVRTVTRFEVKSGRTRNSTTSDIELIRREVYERIKTIPQSYWTMLRSTEVFDRFISSAVKSLDLRPEGHWQEALRTTLGHRLPGAIAPYFRHEFQNGVEKRIRDGSASEDDLNFAAWFLLVDIWIWVQRAYKDPSQSPFNSLAEATRTLEHAALRFSNVARDISHGVDGAEAQMTSVIGDQTSGVMALLRSAGWPLTEKPTRRNGRRRNVGSKSKVSANGTPAT